MASINNSLVIGTDDKCMRAFALNKILKMEDSRESKAVKQKKRADESNKRRKIEEVSLFGIVRSRVFFQ